MNMRIFIFATLSLVLSTANANIIDDTYGAGAGSFELGNFVPTSSYAMSLVPSDTTITGWTVGAQGGGTAWLNGWNPSQTGTLAPFYAVDTGAYAVSLQDVSNGSIAITIPTTLGAVYELSFAAAGSPSYWHSSWGNIGVGVVSAGSLVDQEFTGPYSVAPYYTQWQTFIPYEFLFTALESTTTIQFTGKDPGTGPYHYGPIIDSVSVTAVPAPATIWLLGSGLAGLIGIAMHKNQQRGKAHTRAQ